MTRSGRGEGRRLTDAQRRDRAVTEAQLQKAVTDLAGIYGFSWVHFRPAETKHGWRTPVEGPLGKGWPDLVLVNVVRRRLMFAELKTQLAQPDADQAAVLAYLGEAGCEVHVWRPSDLGDPVETGAIARAFAA
jgi:hypothetical protein